eukprot:8238518-Ditylum_brightwellii.AAC.1
MSNLVYFEKFKNLVKIAEEHGASIDVHPELLSREAANPDAPTEEEKIVTKGKFFRRIFILKTCQYRY